jgi:hypothetical protein
MPIVNGIFYTNRKIQEGPFLYSLNIPYLIMIFLLLLYWGYIVTFTKVLIS